MFLELFGYIKFNGKREHDKPFFSNYVTDNLNANIIKAFNCTINELPFNIKTFVDGFNSDLISEFILSNKLGTSPYFKTTPDINTVSIMNFFYLMQKENLSNFLISDFLFKMTAYDDDQKAIYTSYYVLNEKTKEIVMLNKIKH